MCVSFCRVFIASPEFEKSLLAANRQLTLDDVKDFLLPAQPSEVFDAFIARKKRLYILKDLDAVAGITCHWSRLTS